MGKNKVSDYSEQIRGVSYKPEDLHEDLNDNSIVLLRANNISDGEINFEDVVYVDKSKVSDKQLLRKGDILVCASSGSKHLVGKAAQVDFNGNYTFGAFCKVVRPGNINYSYLGMYFQSREYRRIISSISQGANINNIKNENIDNLMINVPGESEQINVAEILTKVSKIIKLKREQLDSLDELIKSRFVEMFGDISTGHYKYETLKLGEVANVGSSHRVFTTEFVEEGIPFYRGTEIGELANGQQPSDPYYISEEHYQRLANDNTKPKIGDLLLPSICNKGQVWMVNTDEPFYYKDGRVLCISADREIYDTRYFQFFMKVKTEIEYPKLGSGSTFAEFKIFLLKDIDVLTPPRKLQEQFASFVYHIDKLKFRTDCVT